MKQNRVLHLGKYVPPEPGGIERFTVDLVTAQNELGTPAALLGHRAPGQDHIPKLDFNLYSARTAARVIHVPISPGFPSALARAISDFQPTVIHLHVPNVSAFSVLASKRARRLPWVVHWHSDVVASRIDRRIALAYQAYRPLEQKLLSKARTIIATSASYAESSQPLSKWSEKVTVVPLGIDPSVVNSTSRAAQLAAKEFWSAGKLKALFVGRLSYYKGTAHLVEAVTDLDGVELAIAGTGSEERAIRAMAAKTHNIKLLGNVSDDFRNALLASADTLVLPSIEKTEAFGLVLLEAMVAGLPVIASDVVGSGMGDVVRSGKHGVLVAPGDPTALRTVLQQWRDDPEQRIALKEGMQSRFESQFHIGAVAKRLDAIYESLGRSK